MKHCFGFRPIAFQFIRPFYVNWLHTHFINKLCKISPDDQVFIIINEKPGSIALNLHYAALWEKERGKCYLFVISQNYDLVERLASIICPSIDITTIDSNFTRKIIANFSGELIKNTTFIKLYNYLHSLRINAISLLGYQELGTHTHTDYQVYFDKKRDKASSKGDSFFESYTYFNRHIYSQSNYWEDYNKLQLNSPPLPIREDLKLRFQKLQSELSISRPYIILNIDDNSSKPQDESFNKSIDYIIDQGYDVVFFQNSEKPSFKDLKFIRHKKYPKNPIEDDLSLIAYCHAMITTKAEEEVFALIFQKPLLGLNYIEPAIMLHHPMHRFAFKSVWDENLKQHLSWDELLSHPGFFNHSKGELQSDLKYHQLPDSEILNSIKEFLPLINQPKKLWKIPSTLQSDFKALLDETNMDLFTCNGLPTESSLKFWEKNEKPMIWNSEIG